MAADTPTYVATYEHCGSLVGAAVADVDRPSLADAVRARSRWQRSGFIVKTMTVQDVRDWPRDKSFEHPESCPRYKQHKRLLKRDGA